MGKGSEAGGADRLLGKHPQVKISSFTMSNHDQNHTTLKPLNLAGQGLWLVTVCRNLEHNVLTNLCPGPVLDPPVCLGSGVEAGNRGVEEGSCWSLSLDRGEGEVTTKVNV